MSTKPGNDQPTQTTHLRHVWTWDFIFDRTDKGSTLKIMTLLDEYTRQSLALQVEHQITPTQVLAVLAKAMARYGVPGLFVVTMALSLSPLKFNNFE